MPLAFVGAIFLGDGLLTVQGYQSGDSDIPVGVALRAGIPAVLVLIAPAICAIVFGLRARRLGMAGAIPALIGLVVATMAILLNALPLALGLWKMFSVTIVIAGAALVVIALVISSMFLRRSDRRLRARAIKRLGFGVIAVFSVLAGVFIAGEAFEEPGGGGAISLVLAWLIPLVGLAGLAWFRPGPATPIMIILWGAVVLASLWFAVDPDVWRAVEDQYGPVRAVAAFVLSAAAGVLGLKRTLIAGWLLVALGLLPIAASILGGSPGVSLSAVSAIPLITGILYLAAARLDRRPASISPRGSRGVLSDSQESC